MRQHNRFRPRGTAISMMLASAMMAGCGGSSMNPGSMDPNPPPGSPNNPSSPDAPPAVMQAQQTNAPVDPAIVTADNAFGVSLFQKLNAGASGNVAIAPISVAMALQIVYNGTVSGLTQQGMAQTLQLRSMSMQDLNDDNAALQGSLLNPDPQVQLTIANSLWLHLGMNSVPAAFTQMDQNYYGATVGDLAGAPANVNDWVNTETNGLITSILPNGNYDSVVAVIANVIYFKGQWATGFDPSQTAPAPFTLVDGSQVSVPMMHQSATYGYFQGANFQALRLPYGNEFREFRRRRDRRYAENLGRAGSRRLRHRGVAALHHDLWRFAGAASDFARHAGGILRRSERQLSGDRVGLHRRRRAQDRGASR
jgi:hypothetical protein